jgi:hypothetical protein
LKSLLEVVHPLLFEKLFQLLFFLNMDLLHIINAFTNVNPTTGLTIGSGNGVSGARTARAAAGLGSGALLFAAAFVHGEARRTEDSFKVFGCTLGAVEGDLFILAHHQQLEKLVTFRTLEFIYRHFSCPFIKNRLTLPASVQSTWWSCYDIRQLPRYLVKRFDHAA